MDEEIKEKIAKIIEPYITQLGLQLFELKVREYQKVVSIEILVDKAEGGIAVDECTGINRYLNSVLEEEQLFENYTIEVASPGIDRPLEIKRDFLRVMGRSVRFHLFDFVEGKKEYTGEVKQVRKNHVVIIVKQKAIAIGFDNISKAVQVI
ncbi:FIG000325: clustered with transcription termination protein NusA [hydrothermal vent metagenome]|uniref:FIG000325: clustered with transcription termination protein NusA n=1 Tax=hydrothermal vent metagenome TaxID=652676 RepID=A0A3B1DDX9_9ZZZZ